MKTVKNKQLIIELLMQDMKHEQLIDGLYKLGFSSDLHGLNISGVVAELLGIKEDDIDSEWFEIYMDFLSQAKHYEICGTGKNLRPLAETCYTFLTSQLQQELAEKEEQESL